MYNPNSHIIVDPSQCKIQQKILFIIQVLTIFFFIHILLLVLDA